MRSAASNAAENPVLGTPYEAPTSHWRLDRRGRTLDVIDDGRRPSGMVSGVPETDQDRHVMFELAQDAEPHRTINDLRARLALWRADRWDGVSSTTRRLLEHWSSPGAVMRPFWCQLEAVETLIWLLEAGPLCAPEECTAIRRRLAEVNAQWNQCIPRVALKMATGTGKTIVMAMIALWWAARRNGPVDILVLAPNLTVRERLEELDPKRKRGIWESITPRGYERHLRGMTWTILNYQQFQRRSGPAAMGNVGGKEKRMLRAGQSEPDSWRESAEAMLNRLLPVHGRHRELLVLNDEAHHCYAPSSVPAPRDADEKAESEIAALWFSALRDMQVVRRLEQVVDLSATPMWLRQPTDLKSVIFPWTICDFPLLDAVESGLVKIPRLPIADDLDSHKPRYRNIYEFANGIDCREGEPQAEIREPLEQLYRHYEQKVNPLFERRGILPILIVVANKIRNAERLYRWIAGKHVEDGLWKPGKLPLFSNVRSDGQPKRHPPTLLVHSKLSDPETLTGGLAAAIEEQARLHAPEAATKAEKQAAIREIFTTAGKKGGLGEHIRCVISVGMLTEGWDARNVTHIFGYRKFGSLLLCEQVTGRALRRTSFSGRDEHQKPEYANIFGVPYGFARGGGEEPPPPPVQPWSVWSVPSRRGFRIEFPNVIGYEQSQDIVRWRLNPQNVEPFSVERKPTPEATVEAGPAGRGVVVRREEREETDIWRAAAQVATLLDEDRGQRRPTFTDSLLAVREWLALPEVKCPEIAGLQFDARALRSIAEACEPQLEAGRWLPVFADVIEPGAARLLSTADVDFETVLQHRYDAKRSELNAAACHTEPEVGLARVLDSHPRIAAWARNFRLGWEVPWFDGDVGSWRRTEPDFVAKAVSAGRKRPLNLIIEFKGMKAGQWSEENKRLWLRRWADAVTGWDTLCEDYGEWRVVWVEDIAAAKAQIDDALAMGECE